MKGYYWWKRTCVRNPASGLLQNGHKLEKLTMTSQFAGIKSSSKFFCVALFFLSLLVTGPRFMPVPLLVLELWQILFIRDWLEIQKSEKPVLVLPNIWRLGGVKDTKFGRMSQMNSYWMLQNGRVPVFTVSKLLRENQQWGGAWECENNPHQD